jgi:hypothetical protein
LGPEVLLLKPNTGPESYYSKHLASTIPLKSLDNILDIECAGGTPLPYKGYIEANIKMPGDTNTILVSVGVP